MSVIHHIPMRSRSIEMYLSLVMVFSGIVFVLPGDTLDFPIYASLRVWVAHFPGSESSLGVMLMLIGSARVAALIINGAWRPTPVWRGIGCVLGSCYWAVLSLAFIEAAQGPPLGLAWTLPGIAFETFSAMKSAEDAFERDSLGLRERHRERLRHRGT